VITTLDIKQIEPLAGGAEFGAAGAFERVIGTARGELDPEDSLNRVIVNLDRAPRNALGRVEYETDFFMLRPVDPGKGSGTLIYEVVNRGKKLMFSGFQDGALGNDPKELRDLGNALFLRRGCTLVWSGWDPDAPRAAGGMSMKSVIATENGESIVRTIREELVSGNRFPPTEVFKLSYPASTLDQSQARLTTRRHESDPRVEVPASQWCYVDERSIRLLPEGTKPGPGWLYELHYLARDPKVLGIGFAATRDVVSWLRQGSASPAGKIDAALIIGRSQSGRFIRNFISDGFNQDENGRRVFDGALAHIAGIGRIFLNHAFGQPWRTASRHEDHYVPENEFPFSATRMKDPYSGRTASLLRRDGFDPLLIETNTSTEYWQKGASLLTTDPLATRDVRLPPGARAYLIAGTQHGGSAASTTEHGNCANPNNPHNPSAVLRALVVALDEWVHDGKPPPASRVPRIRDGTAVPADATGFPDIPGMTVTTKTNAIAPFGDWVHPAPDLTRACHTLVSKVDADGNEVAGIRLPDIAVPLATYTGWNVFAEPWVAGELGDRDGSWSPFAKTRAERKASGDPRRSLKERYPTADGYVRKVQRVTDRLVRDRLLLAEDAEAYVAAARRRAEEGLL